MDSGFTPAACPGMTDLDDLVEETRAYGHQRIERERLLDRLLAEAVALHPAGFAMLRPRALAAVEPELAERLLGRVAACIGGSGYPTRRERLARLYSGFRAAPERARTLGGCRFVPSRGQVLVLRELARAAPPARLEPGAGLLWDRRIAAELPGSAPSGFILGYLGQFGVVAVDRRLRDRRADTLPRLLFPVLPALWDEAGLAAVPHLCYRRSGVGMLPALRFRPANPLTRASFTVV
jgi:tRNA(Ile)-lysidine synthase